MKPGFKILALFIAGMGVFCLVIPLFPAVPLLLLAVFLFSRGFVHFNEWFTRTRFCTKYVRASAKQKFIQQKTMTVKEKFSILIPATIISVLAAIVFSSFIIRALLIILLLIKYYFFLFIIKTGKE